MNTVSHKSLTFPSLFSPETIRRSWSFSMETRSASPRTPLLIWRAQRLRKNVTVTVQKRWEPKEILMGTMKNKRKPDSATERYSSSPRSVTSQQKWTPYRQYSVIFCHSLKKKCLNLSWTWDFRFQIKREVREERGRCVRREGGERGEREVREERGRCSGSKGHYVHPSIQTGWMAGSVEWKQSCIDDWIAPVVDR